MSLGTPKVKAKQSVASNIDKKESDDLKSFIYNDTE